MGHFLDIISGYLGVCWSMLGKNEKMPQPLVNTGFTAFLCHERAGIRTPDNLIKSQVLYHLSYTPILGCLSFLQRKCPEPESNQRHEDFQSSALPTELSGH